MSGLQQKGVVRWALATVNDGAVLEPCDVSRADGKRSNGLTLNPRSLGPVTNMGGHIDSTCFRKRVAFVVELAKRLKNLKFQYLRSDYLFALIGVEFLDPWVSVHILCIKIY